RRLPSGAFGEERPSALREGKQLTVLSSDPLNAEPALAPLAESWLTPVSQFFIRTHGNTPELDAKSYRLTVEGLVERPLTLKLGDLQEFERAALTATVTCAGNRRAEHSAVKKVGGVQWGP